MGASHAQRDIFHQYLIEAAIAGGRLALARALLSERSLTKPNSLGNWMRYAAVLDQLGEAGAAAQARERGAAVKTANLAAVSRNPMGRVRLRFGRSEPANLNPVISCRVKTTPREDRGKPWLDRLSYRAS